MAIKKAVQVGNSLIRARAKNVSLPTAPEVQSIVKNLIDSMRHYELVGMAAPQIGKGVRVFVTEIRKTKVRRTIRLENLDPLRIFINPKILSRTKMRTADWEGCGSVASGNLFGIVRRPSSLTLEAFDEQGIKFKLKANNLLARVIQHEMDHLDGVVFTDTALAETYMSRDEYLKFRARKP